MKVWRGLVILAILVCAVRAADGDGGTVSVFHFGAGARELSLGGAVPATCDISTAPFWNPSRLAAAEQVCLAGFYTQLFESDAVYQYVGLAVPTLDFGTFGVGVFRLGVGGIEQRDAGNVLLGEIEENRLAFYFAYGRTWSGYDVGIATTVEHHSLGSYNSTSTPGLNLSLSRRFYPNLHWVRELAFTVMGSELLQPEIELADQKIKQPSRFDAAATIDIVPNRWWDHLLSVSLRYEKTNQVDPKFAVGLEYSLENLLHLRGGWNDNQPAFGMGLSWGAFSFDYAFVSRDLDNLHLFSFTTSFGAPVSVRKQHRQQQREVEFNRLMNERLSVQQQAMVNQIVTRGKEAAAEGKWADARHLFDRALFLARANNFDTVEVNRLALLADEKMQTVVRQTHLSELIDSADAKFQQGDYLAAKYFASQAVSGSPQSDTAQILLAQAEQALEKMTERDQLIRRKILTVDSLVSYGHVDQALELAQSLEDYAPEHEGVALALKRAAFEKWRAVAMTALTEQNWSPVQAALDSMDSLFPNHPWTVECRQTLRARMAVVQTATAAPVRDSLPPLSTKVKEEIDELYRNAQKAFENGDLQQAIRLWEQVERLAPGYRSVRSYLVEAYKYVGVELYGQNQLAEAIEVWRKAVRLMPENEEISSYISRTQNEIARLKQLSYER
jgi:tetratricopeptide (TPR) repeat protein